MSSRLLLAGYFGCGNLGDDAILIGFAEAMRKEGHSIRVLAGQPQRLTQTTGLVGVPRMEMAAVEAAIQECDWLVFPGGSIFQDATSVKSTLYYSRLVKMAKDAGKKAALINQGIGPLRTFAGRRIAMGAFRRCDLIVVRDPASGDLLRSLGVMGQIHLGADSAFLLDPPRPDQIGEPFGVGSQRVVGISARPWGKDKGAGLAKIFSALVDDLVRSQMMPVMIEMDSDDRRMIDLITKQRGGKVPDIKNVDSPLALQSRFARMEAVIAMRLHAGILAATAGIPCCMVSYDPKVTAFANQIGAPAPLHVEGLEEGRLIHAVQEFLREKDQRTASLLAAREKLRRDAEAGVQALAQLLR
jgi:polysaccharide pyruvyl transferase CsaB